MDETGWKVGGRPWWLWVAVDEQTTVYAILEGRGYKEAVELIGAEFDGFLIHDGWRSYYGFKLAFHQSCQRHLITRCNEIIKLAAPQDGLFPLEVKRRLLQGLETRDRYLEGMISEHGLAVATGRLEATLERLLDQPYQLPEDKKLAKHLLHEFDYLFTYLKCPGLEATNWRGEQAIRPAVVTRKVWGGNRNERGANTQKILASVLRTSRQRQQDPVTLLANLQRSPLPYVLPLPRPPGPN
jgi:transposase